MFDINEQPIDIHVYYKTKTNKYKIRFIKIISQDEIKVLWDGIQNESEQLQKLKSQNITDLHLRCKIVNYKQTSNSLIKSAIPTSQKGEINMTSYKQAILKKCITWWNIKDQAGNALQVSDTLIQKMPTQIFHAVYEQYKKITDSQEQQVKK